MLLFRKSRFLLLVTRELYKKYTLPLLVGFILGLFGMVGIGQFVPLISGSASVHTIRIGMVADVTPQTLPLSIQKRISKGLTDIGPDGLPIPALAAHWESTDSGKTYLFTLADRERWHNGNPVHAKDINYNIRDVSFTVLSPFTLRATLNEPFSPFLTLVAKPILQTGLRGFGPYRVTTIRLKGDSVQYLRLDPVENVFDPGYEYRFYKTEATATTAFALGDVDVLEDVSSPEAFKNWKNIAISSRSRSDRVVVVYFNTKDSLLAEKGFRQALAYAIPKLGLERAYAPIPKTSWAYVDAVKKYEYDPIQAKKLMEQTKGSSPSAVLTISTFPQFVDVAQTIATSWTNLGVSSSVQVVNAIGPFQILLSAQTIPPDPDQYSLWHSTQTATNITGYVNVKIDKLLEDGRKEPDIQKRKKIYADFSKRLVEDAPAVFLYYPVTYTISRL